MAFKVSSFSKLFDKKPKPQTAKMSSIGKPKKSNKNLSKKAKKERLKLRTVLIIVIPIVLLLVVTASGVFAYDKIYENKIYLGVYLADINLGGMTKSEAESLLNTKLSNYQKENISLVTISNRKWNPSLSKLGFKVDVKKSVDEAYNIGREKSFFANLGEQLSYGFRSASLPVAYELNQKNINEYLNSIGQEVNKPAVNATFVFEGTDLKPIPSKEGLVIDRLSLKNQIEEALKYFRTKVISIPFKVDEPKVEEEATREAKAKAKAMVASPITFIYEDQVYTADPTQIASWIAFVPAKKKTTIIGQEHWYLNASLNEDKVREYLTTISSEINVEPKNTKIYYTDGQKFVLEQGYEGKTLDLDNAMVQIRDKINQPTNREIALAVKTVPAGEIEATSYGIVPITKEKYIDVSLSGQVLTCFDGGKAQFVTLISSGIDRYPTPTGTFAIYSKTPSTRMRHEYGPGNPDNYDLPDVPYAMFFSGPYSLHGTYWHSNFGTPMSHGCVNLPTPAAEWVYNWAPVGTMVYVHW